MHKIIDFIYRNTDRLMIVSGKEFVGKTHVVVRSVRFVNARDSFDLFKDGAHEIDLSGIEDKEQVY